jgi:hypothetical protein
MSRNIIFVRRILIFTKVLLSPYMLIWHITLNEARIISFHFIINYLLSPNNTMYIVYVTDIIIK